MTGFSIGGRIAPPRFLLFIAVFCAGLAGLIPSLGLGRGTMAAFDIAATVFLLAVGGLLKRDEAAQMRAVAVRNDANRVLLLGITGLISLIVLVAAIIPACRRLERRWEVLSDAAAADEALRPLYRRDQMILWLVAIGLPFALTALFKAIGAAF